jgi:hypothetical protein
MRPAERNRVEARRGGTGRANRRATFDSFRRDHANIQ